MIPNIQQSVEELLKVASPATKIMWQQIRLLTGEIGAVQQLFYQGVMVGSQFGTYAAGTLYVALDLLVSCSSTPWSAANKTVTFYDENNALNTIFKNCGVIWDATAAAAATGANDYQIYNIYFSRITGVSYNYIRFIGFKIVY